VDMELLRTYVMGMGNTLPAATQRSIAAGAGDISGNGTTTIMDVALLRTYVMGLGHTLTESVQARLAWSAAWTEGQ